jgi:putative phosphoribosyl transferase
MAKAVTAPRAEEQVRVTAGTATLQGDLVIPEASRGLVMFAHGSGSSRLSPRNRHVADVLNEGGLATLLFDLLTQDEEIADARTGHLRFDIRFLATRVAGATRWASTHAGARNLRIGYFGASTGAAAALVAAAELPGIVHAVVSRAGRPDLAIPAIPNVTAPTLLIVGGDDTAVLAMNREALTHFRADAKLEIVPGASHLFEEPGTLETVARLARAWFQRWLGLAG